MIQSSKTPSRNLPMIGSWQFHYNSGKTNNVDLWCQIWYQRWFNPPKLKSGTIIIPPSMTVFLMHFFHARELLISMHDNSWCQIWHQRWPNPPKPQSGTINVLQVWLYSWCTFNHARELKICIQLKNDIPCWFMM